MSERTIRVVLLPHDDCPYDRTIPATLEALQDAVGGYIQSVPLAGFVEVLPACLERVDVICNDEGMLLELPTNVELYPGQPFFGNILFTAPPDDEGGATSLSDEQVRELFALIERHVS